MRDNYLKQVTRIEEQYIRQTYGALIPRWQILDLTERFKRQLRISNTSTNV